MTFHNNLTALFLLIAVLLAPLNSFAHEVTTGAAKVPCACHLTDCSTDGKDSQPDNYPGSNGADCCDTEECCPDATEPPASCNLSTYIPVKQHFQPHTNGHFPRVYLTIFVPPENSSLR